MPCGDILLNMRKSGFGIGLVSIILSMVLPLANATEIRARTADELDGCNFGLTFRSHKYPLDERTGLNLTPDRHLNLSHGFSIDFDLCLNREDAAYGYVMRLISGNRSALDINANINTGNLNFVLIRDGNTFTNVPYHDEIGLEAGRWMHVSVSADASEIRCAVDSVSHLFGNRLSDLSDIEIYFGACADDSFYSTDVAPMTVRNIVISTPKGVLREWRLCRNNGTEVYDGIHGARACVTNGVWEVDKHTEWTPIWSGTFDSQPEIAYDRGSAHLFVATSEAVVDVRLPDGNENRTEVKAGGPFLCGGSQMIYDPESGCLVSYSVQFPEFTVFDFMTGRWSSSHHESLPRNQQHSRWFDPDTRMLYVFGGYGNHLYNSDFYSRNIDTREWHYTDLAESIAPRYLAAMGMSDGNLLVMGGYGNRSGRQEESPRNMHDINMIDMLTCEVTHVSDFSMPDDRYSMASTLVCDVKSGKIYTLAFDNGHSASSLNLISVAKGSSEAVFCGNPIPYTFHDIESYSELTFNPDSTSLYAIVSNAANDAGEGYSVVVYELAYPPISSELVRQQARKTPVVPISFALAVVLIAVGATVVILVKRNKGRENNNLELNEYDSTQPRKDRVEKAPSSISLLGGLAIIDADGNNVTTEFTPVVRQLLLLLLMNSRVKSIGITSEVLDDTLWFGMEKKQAANNRNVNIRKLRLKLEKVWNIELSNRNGYWFFDIDDFSCCDYLEVCQLLKDVLANPDDRNSLTRLLTLVMNGPLLPDNDFEWLDDYKSRYTDMIVEKLVKIQRYYEDDCDMSIMIARAMRVLDILDEEAIRIYCRALYRKGNKSLSISVWDKFTEDYRRVMGTLPDFSYSQIIEGKTAR